MKLIRTIWILLAVCCVLPAIADDADQRRRYDAFFLEAVCQRQKGNTDAAFDLMRHCMDIDSTRSEAYSFLSQYYSHLKDKQRALQYCRKAAALEPENTTYLATLADALLSQREYNETIGVLEQLYSLCHDRDDVLGMLVQLYEQQEQYDKAIDALTRLEVLEGKSERLSYAKSNLYTKKGDKRAAIAEMKTLADQYPNDNNYRCLYANTLYINGQKKKAVAIYNAVLRKEPDHRNALLAMLAYYNDQKDSVHVQEYTEKVLFNKQMASGDRVELMRRFVIENEQTGGDSTRVLQLFHRLLQGSQEDADMALLCASYMNLKKMPEDSIRVVLEQGLQIAPDNAAVRLQLVMYAWQAQDLERVIDLCTAARQYNPEEMAFYYYQGIAYYKDGNLDGALNAFQNGISVITPQSDPAIASDFYAVLGDILHQKGLEQEAFAAYDSCLVWKDDNLGCLNNYAYYLSEKNIRLDEAERMSLRTIKAEPKNATYLDTYAWILFMQKRYSEAKIYIDQTLQNDSDTSAVLLEHAGDIYAMAGDIRQALVFWQQALERIAAEPSSDEDRSAIITRKIKLKKYLKE